MIIIMMEGGLVDAVHEKPGVYPDIALILEKDTSGVDPQRIQTIDGDEYAVNVIGITEPSDEFVREILKTLK